MQAKQNKQRQIILIVGAILTIVVSGLVTYSLLMLFMPNASKQNTSKNGSTSLNLEKDADTNRENVDAKIPESWKRVNTDYGFSVKLPSEWGPSMSGDFIINNFSTKSNSYAKTNQSLELDPVSTELKKQPLVDTVSVSIGRTELVNDSSKDQLIKAIVDAAPKDKQSKRMVISGKEWIQIDGYNNSRSLYHWVDGYAVSISSIADDDTDISELTDDILVPIAVSVEVVK